MRHCISPAPATPVPPAHAHHLLPQPHRPRPRDPVPAAAVPRRHHAGRSEIGRCSPPGPDGTLPDATLAAAELAGVHRVFKIGGAQAIAAMAFGTESVPRVDKLFGAGNAFVTAAKLLAFPECALDA